MGHPRCVLGTRKKAIQSLRLRLHSSFRQSGIRLLPDFCGTVETVPFRFMPQKNVLHAAIMMR
ncbi:hypothetical protein HDF15_001922 [Granulicella mallensis]|uniref:Uncharacterized protein n=1 Tax=Granulicella mallensis TaxID=940614 RepID=A0A7W7ZP55_9BACT|nr:hypothetical protein [Granulicella mallensis]